MWMAGNQARTHDSGSAEQIAALQLSQRRQHRSDRGVIRAALSAMRLNRGGGWVGKGLTRAPRLVEWQHVQRRAACSVPKTLEPPGHRPSGFGTISSPRRRCPGGDLGWHIESSDSLRQHFALISGTRVLKWESRKYGYSDLRKILRSKPTLYAIAEQIQFVLWTLEGTEVVARACGRLSDVIDASPGISVRLVHQDGKAILYPTERGFWMKQRLKPISRGLRSTPRRPRLSKPPCNCTPGKILTTSATYWIIFGCL